MPELPEVESFRRLAERWGHGQKIAHVEAFEDSIVFQDCEAEEVAAALRGKTLVRTERRGKYLWFELSTGPHPLFHFGMTGRFVATEEAPLDLETQAPSDPRVWPPRFAKLVLQLAHGPSLAYLNARRFGRIQLLSDPKKDVPISPLGVDPLLESLDFADLETRLSRSRSVKALLLDQKIFAGVGNWIADEVLFQSGIDPRRQGEAIDPQEWAKILGNLKTIVHLAVEVGAQKSLFPEDWLFHSRWQKRKGSVPRRTDVEFLKVAGRTTAWVPALQS